MIKLVLFDLDGVLIDAKEIHYTALNEVLPEEYRITRSEHINLYDGKKTTEKLRMLTDRKGLPADSHSDLNQKKQGATLKCIAKITPIEEICLLFKQLEDEGYTIGVCSNSVRRTVLTALAKAELMQYVTLVISNEDVHNSKPHPEMYWKAMSTLGFLPEETLIVEDSPPGLLAAERSKANYIRVNDPYDVTRDKIMPALRSGKQIKRKWENKKMNVLIPMAGAGSRFAQAGYTFPKPLIDVQGKPMIQVVVENLGMDANYIFVVQKEHREKYALDTLLNMIAPNCKIVEVDGMTEGAACTALLARDYIDNDEPLFFANSDQYVEWNPVEFMYEMQERDADGGIVTFKATHPKWSFAKVDGDGLVTEVAEKKPISDNATVGFYYWKHGSDFVKYADQMIADDVRVNGEFYVCPVFNEAIKGDMAIRTYEATEMWGLGTPEDLNEYLRVKSSN